MAEKTYKNSHLGKPEASVFVSANAGSGKTTLLVNRVLSLLCHRVAPEKILCLTYTNAAAAEMKNRIITALGQWVMLPDNQLSVVLQQLLGEPALDETRVFARGLFARVLDSPEGVRIHTLHGFCQSLLARFPLEAGISPHFKIIEPFTQKQLLKEALHQVYADAGSDAVLADALAKVAAGGSEERFLLLMQEVINKKASFANLPAIRDYLRRIPLQSQTQAGSPSRESAWQSYFQGYELDEPLLKTCMQRLLESTATSDLARGEVLELWLRTDNTEKPAQLAAYLPLFLTQQGKPKIALFTRQSQLQAEQIEALLREQQRVVELCESLESVEVIESSTALIDIAARLLSHYDTLKLRRLGLDYDDLIVAGCRLLSGEASVPWVLFKLDEGIDHLMVDEAQDTSPQQWQIVSAIAEEFFAGDGRAENPRSLFVVGDEKQSIFSFQGADVEVLPMMQEYFLRKIEDARAIAHRLTLKHSYRSTPEVLGLVDHVFASAQARAGVADPSAELSHVAIREQAHGFVEIWPVIRPDPSSYQDAAGILAQKLALQLRHWLDSGLHVASRGRALQPGDVMILVRQRTSFVDSLVKALKRAEIPVAGADRLKLLDSLVVQDLLALARFCLLPEDDLNLACLLKSPLCGVSEDQLMALALSRQKKTLWQELQQHAPPSMASDSIIRQAHEFLEHMRSIADYEAPYAFFACALDMLKTRGRIVGRMGHEHAEVIDEFLGQALSYAKSEPPTLQGFIDWLESSEGEIKRDLEQGFNAVRIMTVHAAKGLQAPLVILPDTTEVPRPSRKEILLWEKRGADLLPLLVPAGGQGTLLTQELKDKRKAAILSEYRRLLYVALTRAEDHLVIAGHTGRDSLSDDSWYQLIQPAMQKIGAVFHSPAGDGHRLGAAHYVSRSAAAPVNEAVATKAPDFLTQPPPAEPGAILSISPSQNVFEKSEGLSPLFNPLQVMRGQLIHTLLQRLPAVSPHAWQARAAVLAKRWDTLTAEQVAAATDEATSVLKNPQWSFLFEGQSKAEVAVSGRVEMAGKVVIVSGQMDRLVIAGDSVWVVDYKTSPNPPRSPQQVPKAYLRQLLLYQRLLEKIYPEKRVQVALLWTSVPEIMPISEALLDETLLSSYI